MSEIRQHLDAFVSASPVVFYTVGPQPPFRHTFVSANLQRLFGYSQEQFLSDSDTWFRNIHPDDAPSVYSQLPQLYVSERIEYEYRFKTLEGRYLWLRDEMCLLRDAEGRAIDIVGCWIDITQRREAEEHSRRLAAAIEQSPSATAITDLDWKVVYTNPAFAHRCGVDGKQLLGKKMMELRTLESSELPAEEIRARLGSGEAWSGEYAVRYPHADSVVWEKASVSPIRDHNGQVSYYVGMVDDITARKRLEQDLIQAREAAVAANRAKSAFLASMSHEIRTPLNAILGFSQLLQRSSLSEQQREQLGIIVSSGEHLLGVLNGVLELSKIEAGKMSLTLEPCDLHDLVHTTTRLFELRTREKHLGFSVEGLEQLPRVVTTDPSKLRQILINLLGNATKFTSKGGITLKVSVEAEEPGKVRLCFAVSDSGPGIAPQELSLLFRHFSQTRSGRNSGSGSGLGLAISREYARLMGGDITVQSSFGRGSCFTCSVVVEPKTEAHRPTRTEDHRVLHLEPGQTGNRILVADQEPDSLLLLRQLLETVGFDCRSVADRDNLIAVAEAWKPDVLICDFHLFGEALEGEEPRLPALQPGVVPQVICVSSSALAEEKTQALNQGVVGFLAKPYLERELFDLLKQVTGLRFAHADDKVATLASSTEQSPFDPKRLQALPSSLRAELKAATLRADLELINRHLKSVHALDAELAHHLSLLNDRFDYETLQALLSKT